MSSEVLRAHDSPAGKELEIRAINGQLLDCWNEHSAANMAARFDEDGNTIGFDESSLNGRAEIESSLRRIFADHLTAAYVGKIREVRFLTPDVALLRALAGMVPRGQADLNPAVNAIQTLVAAKRDGWWRIALFQNTPAQVHGRPELAQQLTEELRQLL